MPNPKAAAARRHPCTRCLIGWIVLFLLPVITAVITSTPALLVFAVPPLSWVLLLGSAVAEGLPTKSDEDAQRLDRFLVEVAGADTFLVGARDDLDWPLARRGQILIAATDFVRHASDEVLRGVAALEHAVPRRYPTGHSFLSIRSAVLFAPSFGTALAAMAIAQGAGGPLPAFATFGFSIWLGGALRATWLAWKIRPATFAARDRRAAELAGDPRHVADALVAMRNWQRLRNKQIPTLVRWCRTVIRPVEPSAYELERASALVRQSA